jgi:hypothetical protein
MARLSISDVIKTQYDQVQTEKRKGVNKTDGNSVKKAISKADSDGETYSDGNSTRVSTSQRNLSGGSNTVRQSSEKANVGFQISFKVRIDTKYPTKPGESCS